MKNLFKISAMAILMLCFWGCKDDDDNKKVKVKIKPTQTNLCEQFAEVICNNSFQCCTGLSLENAFGVEITTNELDCRRDIELICDHDLAEAHYSMSQNRVVIDTSTVEKCLTEILAPKETCFPFREYSYSYDDCDLENIFTGQVASGGDCLFNFECAGEAFCNVDRRCKDLGSSGDSCNSYPCKKGLFCQAGDDGDRTCVKNKSQGQDCNPNMPCEEGLHCEPFDEPPTNVDVDIPFAQIPTGTCVAKRTEGQECKNPASCESLNCLPALCDDGRQCYSDSDCTGYCEESTATSCGSNDDCPGTCSGGYDNGTFCADDSDCRGTCSGTGALCSDNAGCAGTCLDADGASSGYVCDSDEYCQSMLQEGSTCDFYQTCENVGECSSSPCLGVGTCLGTPVCASNYVVNNYCELGLSLLSSFHTTASEYFYDFTAPY